VADVPAPAPVADVAPAATTPAAPVATTPPTSPLK
jgi:hypothetical protein